MICQFCGKEIEIEDPNYNHAQIHQNCGYALQDEMDALEMIKIVSRSGDQVSWSLTESFEQSLNNTIEETRSHVIHDHTYDDDIIDLICVVKTVHNHISDTVLEKNIPHYSGFIFNGLMTRKYGFPVPKEKQFSSRMKEFIDEIQKINTDKEEFEFYHNLFIKVIPTAKINENLDDKLTKAVLEILKEIEDKFEEDFDASPQWRRFRIDELLLQTVQNMVTTHLQTAPEDSNISLTEKDIEILNKSTDRIFKNIVTSSVNIARKNNVPVDVILARILPNIIVNLIGDYVKLKMEYSRRRN
jgi:uncharacterized protein YejL (UPF0352 family)